MSLPTPKEFGQSHRFSIGLLVYIFLVGVGAGAGVVMFNYALAEISGVRSDMEKEDAHLLREIERLELKIELIEESTNGRINRKLNHHNVDKNAHK